MSGNGRKKAPLVAERRYRGAKKQPTAAKPAQPRKRRKAAPKRRRGPIGMLAAAVGFVLRMIWGLFWRGTVAVLVFVAGGVAYYAATLPPIDQLVDGRAQGSVTMLDQYGDVFATRGSQFGGMVTFESASPHLSNAIIATEDRRFYWHPGVDPIGIASAIRGNLTGSGNLRGGSTLTQQTAKLLCNGRPYVPADWDSEAAYEADCRQASLWRKAQEAVYAMALEVVYTKEDILTIYMNRAYMGGSTYGAEAAANRFFGVTAAEINPQQGAMLAGLLQAPSRLSPLSNLERSQNRSLTVLRLMHDQGYLDDDQYLVARTNPATLTPGSETSLPGGAFADWVMQSGPEFFTRDTTEDVRIETTLVPRIQLAAEEAVLSVYNDGTLRQGSEVQAAVVVMSADGAVRAMVGGTDVRASGLFNRAISAVRQPGSSFKPFVYGTALELGYSPNDMINDVPTCWTTPGSGEWCPQNYSGGFSGLMTLTDALRTSANIPAIILSETVERENVITVASGFGIDSALADGPALALGASEVTLIELTGAYAGILNGGSAVIPYGFTRLTLRGNPIPVMEQEGGIGERVIREDAARQLTWMMHQVVESGTGARARIPGHQLAGKTGTTNDNFDAWFVGFSGDYVVGVWMGYDTPREMGGITGSSVPAEIWRRTMEGVLQGVPAVPLPMTVPEGAGDMLAFDDTQQISDAELDILLAEQFGVVNPLSQQPTNPTDPTVDSVLDDIFGNP